MALALYRKYRPATFAEVVGQEHVTEPLSRAIEAGRINHAYLFSGPRGCGKTSSARILARSLNCELGPTATPCGVCHSCISLAPGGPGNIDVTELDAASHGGVDDTRELRDRAFFAPAESRYRVFIVDEAHMITTQGFNALLKIVEEPPEHVVFVFATTEPEKVLPTIRSRTHHYPFRLIPPGTLRALLERVCADEGVAVAPAVYPLVIRAGGGSARDSLSVLDQLVSGAGPDGVAYERAVALLGVSDVALIDDLVDGLAAGDRAAVFETVDRLVEAGHDPRRFAADLLQRLRDLTLVQAVPEAVERGLVDAAADEVARMAAQAARLGEATLTRYGEIVHAGLVEMRGATAPRLLLELLCARMLLPAALPTEAGLLERLERLERRNAIATGPDRSPEGVEPDPVGTGRGSATSAPRTAPTPTPTDAVPPAPTPPAGSMRPRSSGGNDDAADRPTPTGAMPVGPPSAMSEGPTVGDHATGPGPMSDAGPATLRGPAPSTGSAASELVASGIPVDVRADDSQAGADSEAQAGAVAAGSAPEGAPALDAAAVRQVWPEVLARAKELKKRTAALLVSATVRAIEGDTLVLSIGTAPLARMLSEQSNLDVIADALHAVLGVRWRIRCVHGDAAAASGVPTGRAAASSAPDRPRATQEPASAGQARPPSGPADALGGSAGPGDGHGGRSAAVGPPAASPPPAGGAGSPAVSTAPAGGGGGGGEVPPARTSPTATGAGSPAPTGGAGRSGRRGPATGSTPADAAAEPVAAGGPPGQTRVGAPTEGGSRSGRGAPTGRGRAPGGGSTGRSGAVRPASSADDGVPLPPEPPDEDIPPEDEQEMSAEAAVAPAARPAAPAAVEDTGPEQAALELLTAQLGARAIDRR